MREHLEVIRSSRKNGVTGNYDLSQSELAANLTLRHCGITSGLPVTRPDGLIFRVRVSQGA